MARPSCGAMSRLRVPLLISRFLPFSVLLGALIAFAGAQPAQRSDGDEGGRPVGAPDPGADDRRQPWRRGCGRSPSTRASWSSRHGRSMPGATTIIKPIPRRKRRPLQRLDRGRATIWCMPASSAARGAGLQLQGVTIYDRGRRGSCAASSTPSARDQRAGRLAAARMSAPTTPR